MIGILSKESVTLHYLLMDSNMQLSGWDGEDCVSVEDLDD